MTDSNFSLRLLDLERDRVETTRYEGILMIYNLIICPGGDHWQTMQTS